MLDSHFFAFAGVAALLVLTPGATMAVVADAAIEGGRRAALWTVAGIGTANATIAVAAAFGLAALVRRAPVVLTVMSLVGAGYLAWLGARALWRAVKRGARRADLKVRRTAGLKPRPTSVGDLARFGRGLLTNYSNPSVLFFYAVVVAQFIPPGTRFLPRYLALGGTHVAMSIVWQGAVGISVGLFAERMSRPAVRRWLDLVTGFALLAFALKLAVS